LEGPTGTTLVETIERQARARTSEWRALPDVDERLSALEANVLAVVNDNGEEVDHLRKMDELSTRRQVLAFLLRDMEAFERDLRSDSWKVRRRKFWRVINNSVIALPQLFTLAPYLPRVFGLAIACRDYEEGLRFLERLRKVLELVVDSTDVQLARDASAQPGDAEQPIQRWKNNLVSAFSAVLAGALGEGHTHDSAQLHNMTSALEKLSGSAGNNSLVPLAWASRLFVHDLARIPFRSQYFPYGRNRILSNGSQLNIPNSPVGSRFVSESVRNGVASLLPYVCSAYRPSTQTLPLPLLFPTRPFTLSEMYLLASSWQSFESRETRTNQLSQNASNIRDSLGDIFDAGASRMINDWAVAFRGYPVGEDLPTKDHDGIVHVSVGPPPEAGVRVAVTSLETKEQSWMAAAVQQPDPDDDRYARLHHLLNEVLRTRPNYVVLPELSVPAAWFMRIAKKLIKSGISVVAGVEYTHSDVDSEVVQNQVWTALTCTAKGFNDFVISTQAKWRAAQEEEAALWNAAALQIPNRKWSPKPIWHHGDFFFSILVCSELTNIDFRRELRGRVDALFVPEWNKDTDVFCTCGVVGIGYPRLCYTM